MALSDYKAETRVIEFKGGSFVVKGLSLVEATKLIRHHLPDLEALFKLTASVLEGKHELTSDDLDQLAITVTEQAPGLVANLIAAAEVGGKGDEEAISAASNLSFPLQVQAVIDVMQLTFDEVGGIKKAFGRFAALLGSKTAKSLAAKVSAR